MQRSMLWRKVASKSLDRTRNDPCINWLNGLNCLVWQDITYILIHCLPTLECLINVPVRVFNYRKMPPYTGLIWHYTFI